MSLLQSILQAQGGGALRELASGFGLSQDQAQSAVKSLLPALTGGIKRNAASPDGMGALLGALQQGGHQRYLDEPERLRKPETTEDGNAILGHLLGGKDGSRAVAGRAAEQTGIDLGVLKKLLPVVATMAMGALGKQTAANPQLSSAAAVPGANLLGMLTPMLDADGDGSAVDDLLGMAKKFF